MRRFTSLVLVAVLAGCGDPEALPRFGETVIAVDVDMPVPKVVSRLRVDLFTEDGTWLSSREIARPGPDDWPVSFSVYSEDEGDRERVFVRLRAYGAGRLRDYLGERFWDWSAGAVFTPAPIPGLAPRLMVDGEDVTPRTEPEPLVTVDRLLLVEMRPGELRQVDVLLQAACAGTMSVLSATLGGGPRAGEAATCVDAEKARVMVEPSASIPRDALTIPQPSQQQRWAEGCATETAADRLCVSGGVTILGSVELSLVPDKPAVPERIVRHAPFHMDGDEVTVARYREALAAGFVPPTPPTPNEGPLGTGLTVETCSFSESDQGRESHALNCVDWATADAFCAFQGGALPTEAQWEHAATLADPGGLSRYPWGNAPPECERAIYGRMALAGVPGVCEDFGLQPEPVDAAPGDVTPLGIRGLAGGMSEWQRDHYRDYDEPCWVASPLAEPTCVDPGASARAVRGGSWVAPPPVLASAVRLGGGEVGLSSFIGFRCVYPAGEASRSPSAEGP